MEIKNLNSNQIITLNDFPVYSEQNLKRYLETYKKGSWETVALCPVIPRDIVIPYLDRNLTRKYKEFKKQHPESEYFLLDGTHRTTAATLTNSLIRAIIFRKDSDIIKARKLTKTGKILYNPIMDKNIEENCEILNKHFTKKSYFQTVKEKTERMIGNKKIPKYMETYFKSKR